MKHILLILALILLVRVIIACPSETGAGYYYLYDHIKYSGNPVLPSGDNDWDYDKHYPSVIYNSTWPTESRFRMWYGGFSDQEELCACYAYSANGVDWTKPSLGLFEYEGSSDNNIILDLGKFQYDTVFDGETYVLLLGEDTNKLPTTRHAVDIYTSSSPDGGFSLTKELPVDITCPGIFHGMAITKRPDGRWYAYYQYRDELCYRSIGAYLSDTTSLAGDWTNLGVLIEYEYANEQMYSINVFRYDDKYYGALLKFSAETDLTDIELWDSEDGQTWRHLGLWIGNGGDGEWDRGILMQGTFVDLGSEWRYYYSGGQKPHGEYPERECAVGYVHNTTATPNFLSSEDGKAIMTEDGKLIYIG